METKFFTGNRMALIAFLSLLLFYPATSQSQEDGLTSKAFETGEFKGLFLEGAFGIQLIQGDKPSVEMRVSDPKAFEYLKVTNEGGLLHLHVDRKPFDFSKINLFVTFSELQHLRIFGSIQVDTRGFLDLENLDMVLEGGAKVNVRLKTGSITLLNKGGVFCELSGVAESLDIRLIGAGHIDAGELNARNVNFKIEGVGTGKVHATEKLNAAISGAGKIKYRGNPQVTENIDGLGSVVQE